MCLRRNKFSLLFLCAASGLQLHAQTSSNGSDPLNGRDNNPYSKYGIGELLNGNNTVLRGMGNVSSAFSSSTLINTDNPASYSFLKLTTFELGGTGSMRTTHGTLNGVDQSYRTGTASLSYMALAVPLKKEGGGGFTIGFRPYSRTYYNLATTVSGNSTPPFAIDSSTLRYNGDGALNYAFLGGSAKIKGLSLGFNFGYLFGNMSSNTTLVPIYTTSTIREYMSAFISNTRTGGIMWNGGLQWQIKLDSFSTLRVGATASLSQKVRQHYQESNYVIYNFSDTVVRDTAFSTGEIRGTMTLPLSYSAGVMYTRNDKWSLGIDYRATQWSGFNSSLNPAMNLNIAESSYKLSLGGEYTPDINDIRNFLARVTYRVGAYTGTDYITLKNTTLSYYGFTAGASIPFKRNMQQVASMHAAVDYNKLGTTDNGLLRQNGMRFTIGFSIATRWFDQYKYQ